MATIARDAALHSVPLTKAKQAKIDAGICMVDGCQNKAQTRGNCWRCNRQFATAIEAGRISEQKLIDAQQRLAPKRRGPKSESAAAKILQGRIGRK